MRSQRRGGSRLPSSGYYSHTSQSDRKQTLQQNLIHILSSRYLNDSRSGRVVSRGWRAGKYSLDEVGLPASSLSAILVLLQYAGVVRAGQTPFSSSRLP